MSDFKTVLVQDPRISDISSTVHYGVIKGAAQNTFQSFPSNSASTSSVSFNISPPSESVVVSREVMLESDIKFKITISGVPATQKAFSYGENDSLQAFPFHSLVSNLSASINNTNVSVNLQDTKDMMLKMISTKDFGKYQDLCPTLVDTFYKHYSDAGQNSELGGYSQAGYDKNIQPRGAFPLKEYSVKRFIGGVLQDDSITSSGLNNTFEVSITVHTVEPVLLSPFIFSKGNEQSEQGFYGLNQLNLTFNIDASMKRFWSTKSPYSYQFQLDPVTPFRTNLLLNFLTAQPSECLDIKNVIPYLEFPRYITPVTNVSPIGVGQTSTVTCQNIQLSKIPDLILIAARKPISSQTAKDSASFYPIEGVSVNFNNQSGLLSNATKHDLYKTSIRNGVQQSWLEWSGYGSSFDNSAIDGRPIEIATIGGVLALNPALDLSLSPLLANGSVGQFNLQVNVDVKNNGISTAPVEIVIICVNSGLITTMAGNSSLQNGLLNKSLIIDAEKHKMAVPKRLVGGSLFGKIGAVLRNIPQVSSAIGKAIGDFSASGVSSAGSSKLARYC
jgi:hypothetical protein